jgi:hypothetical protein
MAAAGESFATPPPAVTPASVRARGSSRTLVAGAIVALVVLAGGIAIGVLGRDDGPSPGVGSTPPSVPEPRTPIASPPAPAELPAPVTERPAPRPATSAPDGAVSAGTATDAGTEVPDGGAVRPVAKRGKRPGLLRGKSGAVVNTEYEEGP